MRTIVGWALMPVAALLLAGCGPSAKNAATDNTEAKATTPSSKPLAATVNGDLARVVSNAGLDKALAGVGPYTLLAPPDATLKSGVDFTAPANRAEAAALLRAHIVPGTLTRADIAAAVDRGGAKGAQMRTMSGGLLTFTKDAEGHWRLSGFEGDVSELQLRG